MRKRLLFGLAGLMFAAMAGPSYANGWSNGTVTSITAVPSGTTFIEISGAHSTAPGCATQTRWALNTSTAAGQSTLAVILNAQAQGKSIAMIGTGACEVAYDSETILYLVVSF